jgi:hypothetical protein
MLTRFVKWHALLVILGIATFGRADELVEPEQRIVDLYKSGKLFDSHQYRNIRAAFADLFEARHADALRRGFGDDYDALMSWLKARPNIKHTFLIALDERVDKLPRALGLFKDLWKRFPRHIEKYGNLAIATAIVWSDERRVYDYRHHQVRTKSTMPDGLVDGPGNFQYLIENEKVMEGRTRHLPWELLLFVVDHRTPIRERIWAQEYYKTRKSLASWHQDVPYDHDMLEGLPPHLQGRDYSLRNIHKYGGVCAMQADFAARVAKSVGIPAVYCWGNSAYRGAHAWWMYVAVQKVNSEQTAFRLLSDGRLKGFEKDKFYTGNVLDPRSGREILDRDLERRLVVMGRDLAAKRQGDLIMRAFPLVCRQPGLDIKARVAYLDRCLKVAAHNEEAWLEFARMVRSGELKEESEKRVARMHLQSLSHTFGRSPDFVWKLYDDLLAVQTSPRERLKLYQQALASFEKPTGARPDLACAARMNITGELCAEEKWQTAARGLIATIRKFPTEGRFVPKMTGKLRELSAKYKGGTTELAQLYLDIVPGLQAYYRGDGKYLEVMFDQAVQFFQEHNLQKYETALRIRVQQGPKTKKTTKSKAS